MSAPAPPPAPLPPLSFSGYTGTPGGLEGVPFWPRAGARLIDLVAHYMIAVAIGLIFGIFIGIVAAAEHLPVEQLTQRFAGISASTFLLGILASIAYHTLSEGMGGATLGKQMLGMVVVKEDSGLCDVNAGLIRSLAYLIDSLFFGLVAYLQMNKSPRQQRLGDRWAGTIVVRRASLPAGSPAAGRSPWGGIVCGCAADGAMILLSLAIKL